MVLEPDAGNDHADVEVVSYAAGSGYFVGVLNNRDQPLAATARLPGKYHVYDVRTHEYQGLVDAWQVRMKPGTAALYACLPYAVSPIVAEPASARAQMGDLWQGKFSIKRNPLDASSAPHAIRIQVLQPDNKPRPEYARVVTAGLDGAAVNNIPFAQNDPTGTWKILASDAISGKSITVEVVLF